MSTVPDRRTGYYAAGRDWPAIPCPIPLEDTYRGLEGITDEDVDAAMDSLAGAGRGWEPWLAASG